MDEKSDSEVLKEIVQVTGDLVIVNRDLIQKFAVLDDKVRSINKSVDKKVKYIDKNVHNKIRDEILQHLSLKWQIYAAIIAVVALNVLLMPYISHISLSKVMVEQKEEMKEFKDTIKELKTDVESVLKGR